MDQSFFYSRLGIVSIGAALVLLGLHVMAPPAQAHWQFAIGAMALFVLICIGLYYAGQNAARSKNKYAFTNLVSLSVFGKMALALALLFVYKQIAKPQNEWFVGIFLWCYVVYTAFEVWFMTRLAKTA